MQLADADPAHRKRARAFVRGTINAAGPLGASAIIGSSSMALLQSAMALSYSPLLVLCCQQYMRATGRLLARINKQGWVCI